MQIIKTTTITSKGQVTIPSAIRKAIGLQPGMDLKWKLFANGTLQLERVSSIAIDNHANWLLKGFLQTNAIIGITGTIGSGKTRLAKQLIANFEKVGLITEHSVPAIQESLGIDPHQYVDLSYVNQSNINDMVDILVFDEVTNPAIIHRFLDDPSVRGSVPAIVIALGNKGLQPFRHRLDYLPTVLVNMYQGEIESIHLIQRQNGKIISLPIYSD
jgi:AbrB family looped-hinge helix DNA binding protein